MDSKRLTIAATLLTIAVIAGFAHSSNLGDTIDVKDWFYSQNHWLMIVLLSSLLMVLCAVSPLPAEVITVANGVVFGPFIGTLVTWSSAMLGAGLTFLYGRHLLHKNDYSFTEKPNHQKLQVWINKWGNMGFALARLMPIVPFFALNIGAAFLPLSAKNYFLITGVCILPHIVLICFFGGQIAGH